MECEVRDGATTTPPFHCAADPGGGGGRFGLVDYFVFLFSLFASGAIGIYFAFFGGRKAAPSGIGAMGHVPMSLSLTSGMASAITILCSASEMYNYGGQYWIASFGFFVAMPVTSYLFLPVLSRLQVKSAYEYLNRRFNNYVGYSMSFLFVLQMLMYSACVVYAPALAFRLGITIYVTIVMFYVVCIFYSSVGGIMASIWSSMVQTLVLLVSSAVVIGRGALLEDDVWGPSLETGRLEMWNIDPDITTRHTLWSILIGGTIYWIGVFSTNQALVQRLMLVPKLSDARRGLWLTAVVLAITYTLLFTLGMLIYAKYRHCDPLSAKSIEAIDQILPLYIMDIMGDYPGVPGLFMAGIFSASISAVEAILKSTSTVAVEGFAEGLTEKRLTDFYKGIAAKACCLVVATLSIGLVFFVERLEGIFQVAMSLNGMVNGVILGVFLLGMYLPWTNSKGAMSGAMAGLSFTLWMCLGAQGASASGDLVIARKPVSVQGCSCNVSLDDPRSKKSIFVLYRVSYLWYSPLGALVTVVVGALVSLVTGPQDPLTLDPALLADLPKWITNRLPNSWREALKLPTFEEAPAVKDEEATAIEPHPLGNTGNV